MFVYFCQVNGCGKRLYSAKSLVGHMCLMHSDNNMLNLTCGIDSCNYLYNTADTFRKHLRLHHLSHWESALTAPRSIECEMDTTHDEHALDEPLENENVPVENGHFSNFLNSFAKHLAFLKLKITESYMLPKSVACSVFQDIQNLFDIYQQELTLVLKKRFREMGLSLSDDLILQELTSTSSFFEIVANKISSDHLFDKYLCDNFKMNSPIEKCIKIPPSFSNIVVVPEAPSLNTTSSHPGESVVHMTDKFVRVQYVPILSTLTNYLEQPDVWASCQQPNISGQLLRNFTDGKIWTSANVAEQSHFIRIHLYSDEVEICNPLGSRKTVHKMSMFYFLVGNIETKHWSRLTNIHLALMCRYKSIKDIDYKKLLEPLLSDIKLLETEGITVQVDGVSHKIFGSIVVFSGDNLTSHQIGGFSTCFSSGRICRQCMATKSALTQLYSEEDCKLRTLNEHTYHLSAVLADKSLSSVYGVLGPSPFSELQLFNPISFFPPDLLHDVTEGLQVVVLGVVLRHIFKEKYLHIKSFNARLKEFKFGQADADKFGPLPADFLSKNKSISGKAVEKWNLFRLLPFLVADVVPIDDEFWLLYVLCREICEIVMAPVINPNWLPYLELLIAQHHKLLAKLSPHSFTPKVHFVTHYPRLILEYGPLRHLWVMRFEAVHQYFKQIARRVRSFRNISATLAKRFQAKKCYEHASSNFLLSGAAVPSCQRRVLVERLPTELVLKLQKVASVIELDREGLLSVKSLVVDGHRFKLNSYVVLDVDLEDVPTFLNIKFILLVGGTWFVCGVQVTVSHFNSHLHAHSLGECGEWVVLHTNQSIDCQSLSPYSYGDECFISLQHKVAGKAMLF